MKYSIVFLPIFFAFSSVSAEENFTAKAIFHGNNDYISTVETEKKSTAKKTVNRKVSKKTGKKKSNALGVNYAIYLLNEDGTTQAVSSKRKFKTGDRFKIGVKVNKPSYAYVLNESPEGTITQIYPQTEGGNYLSGRKKSVILPARGAFEFKGAGGTEILLIYLTQKPMYEDIYKTTRESVPDMIDEAGRQTAYSECGTPLVKTSISSGTDLAQKNISFTSDNSEKCMNDTGLSKKSIVFTEDVQDNNNYLGSYVVKESERDDLFLKIKLTHENE